jgi:hypothetical protein
MRSYLRLTLILCVAVIGCKKGETAPDPAPVKAEAPAEQAPTAAPTPVAVPTVTTSFKPPTEHAGLGNAFTSKGNLVNGQPVASNTPPKTTGPAFGSLGGTPTAQPTPTTTAPPATTAAPKPTATATAATPGRGVPPPPGGRPKPGSKK